MKKAKGVSIDQVIEDLNNENLESIQEPEQTELLKAFNSLKAENEALKQKNNKVLNFEEAATIFREKAKLLDQIGKLEAVKNTIKDINVTENNSAGDLDSYYYKLGLFYSSRNEPIFKISNILVIDEFLDFIFVKLDIKIEDLKLKVQEL